MNPYSFLFWLTVAVVAIICITAAWETVADKWATYQDGARRTLATRPGEHYADVNAVPETTAFDPKPDVVRARLASVPAQPMRHLRAVRNDAMTDAEWERLWSVVDGTDTPPPAHDSWQFAADLFPLQRIPGVES